MCVGARVSRRFCISQTQKRQMWYDFTYMRNVKYSPLQKQRRTVVAGIGNEKGEMRKG